MYVVYVYARYMYACLVYPNGCMYVCMYFMLYVGLEVFVRMYVCMFVLWLVCIMGSIYVVKVYVCEKLFSFRQIATIRNGRTPRYMSALRNYFTSS